MHKYYEDNRAKLKIVLKGTISFGTLNTLGGELNCVR